MTGNIIVGVVLRVKKTMGVETFNGFIDYRAGIDRETVEAVFSLGSF